MNQYLVHVTVTQHAHASNLAMIRANNLPNLKAIIHPATSGGISSLRYSSPSRLAHIEGRISLKKIEADTQHWSQHQRHRYKDFRRCDNRVHSGRHLAFDANTEAPMSDRPLS